MSEEKPFVIANIPKEYLEALFNLKVEQGITMKKCKVCGKPLEDGVQTPDICKDCQERNKCRK